MRTLNLNSKRLKESKLKLYIDKNKTILFNPFKTGTGLICTKENFCTKNHFCTRVKKI